MDEDDDEDFSEELATENQLASIIRLGGTPTAGLTEEGASEMIGHLQQDRDWRNDKIEHIHSNVDDWREFYKCAKVSLDMVTAIYDSGITWEREEKIDKFMDRFFRALKMRNPELFP